MPTVHQESKPWEYSHGYLLGTNNQGRNNLGPGANNEGIFPMAQRLAGTPMSYYPGQTYADMSPERMAALAGVTGLTPQVAGFNDTAFNTLQNTAGGMYTGQQNPYLDQVVSGLGDRVQQQVGSRFAGAGRSVGSPAEVQTFNRDLMSAVAPYMFNQYGQERQMQQDAAIKSPALSSLAYTPYQMLGEAGQQYEAQTQKGIDEAVARHNFAQEDPWTRLNRYSDIIYGGTSLAGTSGSQSQGGTSESQQYLGGGLSLLGAAAPFAAMAAFSDRRLKRDIKQIGELPNGLPWYRFRYVWSNECQEGVMADEVECIMPEAIIELPGGYRAVDYAMVMTNG